MIVRRSGSALPPKTLRAAASVGLAFAMALGSATATARPLEAVSGTKQKIRIDGLLREWPAKLDALSTVVKGRQSNDPKVSGVIGYDDKNVYVAMKIADEKLIRTAQFGKGEDYGELILAFPTTRGFKTYRVGLYAGVSGRSAGQVKMIGGGKIAGAKIVEAPSDGGYLLEAAIPWKAFPEARRMKAGLRASLRYNDSDSPGSTAAVVATAAATSGKSLPPLLLEQEQGLFRSLIYDKDLPQTPARTVVGDVAGDSNQEVVSLYGGYLTIVGGGYRGGKEFFYQDLGVRRSDAVTRLELEDLTADGKDDIVIEKRVGDSDEYRRVLSILSFSKGSDAPAVAFQHETAIVTKDGKIENSVTFSRKGGKVGIQVAQGKAEGFDPATYAEPMPGDMESALLPWQSIKSRTFEWDGKRFDKADEETWDPPVQAPSRRAEKASRSSGGSGAAPPPPPRPPSPDEMLDRVYALYRKDRGVGKARPRFDFVTNVAGDSTPERVLVHGKDIVVFGKKFKEGASYVFITIGVEDPKDIFDVTARDLTGDGRAEVVARAVLHAKASEQLGGDVVDRHALFVYETSESGIKRIFAAETGRSLDENSIVAGIRFVPSKKGVALELHPGRAIGWTEKTYPFPIDRAPYGGLEPLLVPWGGEGPRRYEYDGGEYKQK